MSPGLQAAQACHTLRQFTEDHPEIDRRWNDESKFLVVLSVPDEAALQHFAQEATDREIAYSVWREPDIDNQVTGIALAPGQATEKLCSQLPLALKEHRTCMHPPEEWTA